MLSALAFGAEAPAAGAATPTPTPRSGPVKAIGIRLLEAPVTHRKDPRARAYVVDSLSPGTTIRRRFEVSNTTDRRWRVALYAAAASIQNNAFTYADGRTGNELTSWITIAPRSLDLAPNSSKVARFTIAVPRTAWRGERYGVIWAQVSSPPDKQHSLGMVSRVGIRVYLNIGPGGEPPSDMQITRLTPKRLGSGQPQLVAQVRNAGGRALDLSGRLVLSHGPGGLRAGPYASQRGVVLVPGATGQQVFTLDKHLPNGPWDVDLDVQSGMVKRHVSAKITFPTSGIGRSVSALGAIPGPWAALALLLLLPAAGIFAIRRHRRSTPGRP